MPSIELETARLRLCGWRPSDADELFAVCADPEVMRYFPAPLTRAQSDRLLERLQADFERQGYGFWAVRERADERLLGFVGLTAVPDGTPVDANIEVGWRLARDVWGRGIASEAARASLEFGFERLGEEQIVAYTARENHRSRRVMERLGMGHAPDEDFEHPSVPAGHHLRPHVVYRIRAQNWRSAMCA